MPGSSAPLLSTSLRRIEYSDDLTVRFLLSRPDTQFGWALASPAGSIVDAQVYDADRVREPKDSVVGSGPFAVEKLAADELLLARNPDYIGRTPARLAELLYRTVPDSATIEDAMTKGTVEVVWRGLDAAAITRLQQQVLTIPRSRPRAATRPTVLTGVRVLQLQWSPELGRPAEQGTAHGDRAGPAGRPDLRLSGPRRRDRPRAGLPAGRQGRAEGHLEEPDPPDPRLRPERPRRPGPRRADPHPTGGHRRAQRQARARRCWCRPAAVDRKAWTATALSWLQPYLDAPLPDAADKSTHYETQFRGTTDPAAANRLLAALQRQSAVDLVMLPISQSDEHLYAGAGVEVDARLLRAGLAAGPVGHRRWLTRPGPPSGVRRGPIGGG